MRDLFREALELQNTLEREGWELYFVGGLAVQIWGQPRLTTDLDLTIFTGLVNESEQVERLLSLFESRFPTREAAADFSRTARILLLKTASGIEIDMMLGGIADLNSDFERSSIQQFTPDVSLRICSAESLICTKTIAGRGQDLVDIENVIIKQSDLDWDYINTYLAEALEHKDISESIEKVTALKDKYYRR